jgi:hypothetical protein
VIATTRGLAVLAAIAVGLLALSLISGPSGVPPRSQLLVPDFDETKVTDIVISWGHGGARLQRVGNGWRVDGTAAADESTIDAIFTALRAARWHRRTDGENVDMARHPHVLPGIEVGDLVLAIGPQVPGLDQTWIFRGGDAYLVDSWVASALVPPSMALRARHPLDCAAASVLTATTSSGSLRIEGAQLIEPQRMWLDELWLRRLFDACARIEIASLDGSRDGTAGLHIVADGSELRHTGRCQDQRLAYIEARIGNGCVSADDLRALTDALAAPAPDLRPLPIDPVKLTLQDGVVIDVAANRVGGADADRERIREVIAALMMRGTARLKPATKPTGTIIAVDRAGTEVVLELHDRAIARRGEPNAIAIDAAAWATITRPSATLRDPVRWREDATNVTSFTLDKIRYDRGAVIGEWTRAPAGTLDPALADALVDSVATLRAPDAPPPVTIAHRLRITIRPPAGAPITHSIELAAPSEQGCAGRVDGAPALFPLPLCTAVAALAARQK